MFLLGLLGLLQITILPGWVWLRAVRIRTQNSCEEGVYCFASSLILNQWLVYFLAVIGQNNRAAWLAIIALEAVSLAFLTKLGGFHFSIEPAAKGPGKSPSFITILLSAFAAVALVAFLPLLVRNWGTVFTSSDDVASWDLWAKAWFSNRIPDSMLYPAMIPASWSIPYALMQTTDVKMFGKAIMPLFSVATLLIFVSLAWVRKARVYLLGCFFAAFFLFEYLGRDFLMTGYVDVALGFFCFLSFYVLYKEGPTPSHEARLLSLFFAAGAALAKQGGLLLFFGVVVYLIATWRKNAGQPRPTRFLRWSTIMAVAFLALWYTPKFRGALHGDSNLRVLTHDIHGGRTYYERLLYSFHLIKTATGGRLDESLFWIFAVLVLGGLLFAQTRRLTVGVVFPAFLIWAFLFSYEVRPLTMAFPFIALECCLVVQSAVRFIRDRSKQRASLRGVTAFWTAAILIFAVSAMLYQIPHLVPRIRDSFIWPMVFVATCLLLAPAVRIVGRIRVKVPILATAAGLVLGIGLVASPQYSDGGLLADQRDAQRLIGYPEVNAALYRLRDAGQLNQLILSNYWYSYVLPDIGFLSRPIGCGTCTLTELVRTVAGSKDVGFLLLSDGTVPDLTIRTIAHCPGVETLFSISTLKLFRIDRPRFRDTCSVDDEEMRPVIETLYPVRASAGMAFNVQSDGSAALSIRCRNISRTSFIVWAETQLEVRYGGPNLLAAEVPARLYAKPGRYSIEIVDRDSGLRSKPMDFEVK